MSIELRVAGPDDYAEIYGPVYTAFGDRVPTGERLDREVALWEPERSLGVVDDGGWVAGAGAFTFELTLPGGRSVGAAGVTMVGVAPTHRRQGLLRAMMSRQLDDVAARGEPVAILTASESRIYGRFGYGLATTEAELAIDTEHRDFVAPLDDPGRCRLVPQGEAAAPFSDAYAALRRGRAGLISRRGAYWDRQLQDRSHDPTQHDGPLWCLVHDDAGGRPDGLATYRIRHRWDDGLPGATAVIDDLFGVTAEVEAALWRFVCDLDLIVRVEAGGRPVDDPLRWRLVDPRRLLTTGVADHLWLRVLDTPATLTARHYRAAGSLVIEVVDRFRPEGAAAGRFALDAGPDGATCAPTSTGADLTLGVADLGTLLLGTVPASVLAGAGRVDEHRPGALAQADLVLGTDVAPYCGTGF